MSKRSSSWVRAACAAALLAAIVWSAPCARCAAQQDRAVPPLQVGPPGICTSRPHRTQKYQQGLARGTEKADALFDSSEFAGRPEKLQRKLGRVLERLRDHVHEAWSTDAGDNRRCRVQGIADGFLARIAQRMGQCILDGAQWGQFAAELYCALSVELGGLSDGGVFVRAPAALCGTLFQEGCDHVYTFVATEGSADLPVDVASFCDHLGIVVSPYAGCRAFTTGDFEGVFVNSRSLDCSYSAP